MMGRRLIRLLLSQRCLLAILQLLPVQRMREARVLAHLASGLTAARYVQESVLRAMRAMVVAGGHDERLVRWRLMISRCLLLVVQAL